MKTTGHNQDGVVVIEFFRTILVYKREASPRTSSASGEG